MKRTLPTLTALLATALVVAGCGGASDSADGGGDAAAATTGKATLNLVAYSTPQVVYDQIIPAFGRTAAGKGIGFKPSYGASGDQSRAVEAGLPADVVTFSTEPDVTRLVKAGLVAADWDRTATKGLVTTSLVSFIVRPGNPKHIRTWADLLKPGVKVLTPNPFTSGAAKWNVLAAYAQASDGGKDPAAGLRFVKELLTKHVVVQDKSGREALQNFTSGRGDVLLSYEYEATTAQKKGQKVDFVTPDDTIRINIDIAKTKQAPAAAQAFIDYVLSPAGQQKFVDWGYRPVDAGLLKANAARFPQPARLRTIDELGGWATVNDTLFDPDKGSIAKIEQGAGVSTSK
jgi:sulfate transport system substrate-binding protein